MNAATQEDRIEEAEAAKMVEQLEQQLTTAAPEQTGEKEKPAPVTLGAWRIKGNRFAELIESVQFHTTASGKLYTNDDGTSQRKIAAGILVYRGGFAACPFKVNARKLSPAKNARVVAEISFVGNRGMQGLMPVGEPAKAEFAELKSALSKDFTVWKKAQGTYIGQANGAATLEGADDLFEG